jgi:hypothetical protein
MSQAAIIINVNDQEQSHANGLSGNWTVLGKKKGEEFALLVVYPTPEIQDIGDERRVVHWLKAKPLARDIVGLRSDAASHGTGDLGTKEKWGLLLCEAEPDLPRELTNAIEEEMEYLGKHRPTYRMVKDEETKAVVPETNEKEAVIAKKQELSDRVVRLRREFEADCKRLVTKAEVQRAKKNLMIDDQKLVAQADRMWARPAEQQNINELHRAAAARLGQERPWAYIPLQLIDCPGCGAKIKENILSCPHCAGWLDEGIEVLLRLSPKERSMKMYPDRYAEPVGAGVPAGGAKAK